MQDIVALSENNWFWVLAFFAALGVLWALKHPVKWLCTGVADFISKSMKAWLVRNARGVRFHRRVLNAKWSSFEYNTPESMDADTIGSQLRIHTEAIREINKKLVDIYKAYGGRELEGIDLNYKKSDALMKSLPKNMSVGHSSYGDHGCQFSGPFVDFKYDAKTRKCSFYAEPAYADAIQALVISLSNKEETK